MLDIITLGIGGATIVAIPIGAAVKKSYSNEHRISLLEADNKTTTERLKSIDGKLDRLIERFL